MKRIIRKRTIKDLLDYAKKLNNTFGPAIHDIEDILSYILKKDTSYLYANLNKNINSSQFARFIRMYKKRKKEIPLAYIFKKIKFNNHEFKVNKNVLIPRPETEQLVKLVCDYVKKNNISNVIEIGTGSGALIISIALELKPTKINYNYIATDISQKAITLARLNGIKNKTNINFRKRNLIHRPNTFIPLTSWVLVSNPPYVESKDLKEPSIKHEPKLALDGGVDGLDFYNKILKQVSLLQNKPKAIFFEIGYNQAEGIELLTQKYFDFKEFKVIKDENGKDRNIFIEL